MSPQPTNASDQLVASLSNASQEKQLHEAKVSVKTDALLMKKSLDKLELLVGMKHASDMLNKLGNIARIHNTEVILSLSPKHYYDLYIDATDELRHLETFMIDEFQKGLKCDDLYELVQYAASIIPRLYLLITVGTVYMKIKEYPSKIILRDLVEMCRGVQHPLRGLFLRNYLLQCTKSLLPDRLPSKSGSADEQDGDINDSIEFILFNFSEMNKLWVRMQYQGHTRLKEKREQERRELRLLVGTNLVRLSQLESINVELYSAVVLPKLLEQVVNCNDEIAQEYLMECIIQVFPDEFHIRTLEDYLKSCVDLHEEVNIKNIIVSLVDRFVKTNIPFDVKTESGSKVQQSLFDIFSKQISEIISSRPNMQIQDIVALHTTVLNLAVKCYTDRLDYVDKVLEITETIFNSLNLDHIQSNTQVSKELIKMLKIPIDLYKNVLILLKIKHYSTVYEHLDYLGRKTICQYLLNNALENETLISTPEDVDSLMQLINPLIVDANDKPTDYEEDSEDFMEEQTLVSRLIHLMRSNNLDEQFIILNTARKHFGNSGKERIKFTLPPIIFKAYELAYKYKDASEKDEKWEKKCDKIFKFCFQTINALIKAELPAELPFRLFLQGSIALCDINYDNCENITYEFISQAIVLYDEDIATNKFSAITLIIGTCQKILHIFGEENCDSLRQNCVTRAAKLLKKPDQCRAVALCTNLFWNCSPRKDFTSLRDSQKVNECLRKCLKIAAQCVDTNAQFELNVEILNYYINYFESKNDQITIEMLNEIITKIKQDVSNVEKNSEKQMLIDHFNRTMEYIRIKSQSQSSCFNGITL